MQERYEPQRTERVLTAALCTLVFAVLVLVLYGLLVPDEPACFPVVALWGILLWIPVIAMLWYDAARRELAQGILRRWARGIQRTGCVLSVAWGLMCAAVGILMLWKERNIYYRFPPVRVSPYWYHAAFLVSGLLTLAGMAALWLRNRARRRRAT